MDPYKLFNSRDELPNITLVVFLFTFITILYFLIGPSICTFIPLCSSVTIFIPETIVSVLLLLIFVYFVIVSIRSIDWFVNFRKRGKALYIPELNKWPEGWIFNGRPEFIDGNLHIKYSRAGLLLNDVLWKNFRMTFDMKFASGREKKLGIVFRARDLDNYFMLEIRGDEHSVAPHIRFKSGWEDTGLKNISEFEFVDFRKIKLELNNGLAMLYYEGDKVFRWVLPTHADIRHYEAGVNDKKEEKSAALAKDFSGNHVQEIPFRLSYGMVGFRAYPNQEALIRNLEIEPL